MWQELSKRQREDYLATDRPFHPSVLPAAVESWASLAAASRARARAYAELGDDVSAAEYERQAVLADERHKRRPPGEITPEQRHQLALATLFTLAVFTYLDGLRTMSRKDVDGVVSDLQEAGKECVAAAFRRHAAMPQVAPFLVTRRRTDPRLEAFVERIAHETTRLFGSALYGVIATITNVAFERSDPDRQTIRAILKPRTPRRNSR